MTSFRQRLDSFYNVITRLGGNSDKRAQARFVAGVSLDDVVLDDLYHFNDLAAIVCDTYPQEALRRGFSFQVAEDIELSGEINNRIEELSIKQVVQDALVWGRVFGDACIFLGVDDGQKVDRPLDYTKIRGIKFLSVHDKRDFEIASFYSNPLEQQFNQPEFYTMRRVTPIRGVLDPSAAKVMGAGIRIHESRLVWFHGARTSRHKLSERAGWHFSALQKPYEVIRDFEMNWASASHLLSEAGAGEYKVKNLLEILSSADGIAQLETRMEAIHTGMSVARARVVDADGEGFTRTNTTFAGVPDMLDRFAGRLAAATGIPVTRLMGESPAGLNATGASDVRFFYDRVENYRTDEIQPGLERVLRCVLYETGDMSEDSEPEWKIEWPSLYVPTDTETATLRKLVADTDAVYINAGVVTPEEITTSRFGDSGYSMETVVNLELREEIANELTKDDIRPPVVEGDPAMDPKAAGKGADPGGKAPAGDPSEAKEAVPVDD